jgi:hypothetical protein
MRSEKATAKLESSAVVRWELPASRFQHRQQIAGPHPGPGHLDMWSASSVPVLAMPLAFCVVAMMSARAK